MKWSKFQRMSVLVPLLICIFLGVYLAYQIVQARSLGEKSYDPQDYGLPAQIGGYNLVAVVAPENIKCPAPNVYQITAVPALGQPQTLTNADIQALETILNGQVSLIISSGNVNQDQVRSEVERNNRDIGSQPCDALGRNGNPPFPITSDN